MKLFSTPMLRRLQAACRSQAIPRASLGSKELASLRLKSILSKPLRRSSCSG
jgi:hypothetical protein